MDQYSGGMKKLPCVDEDMGKRARNASVSKRDESHSGERSRVTQGNPVSVNGHTVAHVGTGGKKPANVR